MATTHLSRFLRLTAAGGVILVGLRLAPNMAQAQGGGDEERLADCPPELLAENQRLLEVTMERLRGEELYLHNLVPEAVVYVLESGTTNEPGAVAQNHEDFTLATARLALPDTPRIRAEYIDWTWGRPLKDTTAMLEEMRASAPLTTISMSVSPSNYGQNDYPRVAQAFNDAMTGMPVFISSGNDPSSPNFQAFGRQLQTAYFVGAASAPLSAMSYTQELNNPGSTTTLVMRSGIPSPLNNCMQYLEETSRTTRRDTYSEPQLFEIDGTSFSTPLLAGLETSYLWQPFILPISGMSLPEFLDPANPDAKQHSLFMADYILTWSLIRSAPTFGMLEENLSSILNDAGYSFSQAGFGFGFPSIGNAQRITRDLLMERWIDTGDPANPDFAPLETREAALSSSQSFTQASGENLLTLSLGSAPLTLTDIRGKITLSGFEQSGSFRLSLRSPSGTQVSLGDYTLAAGTQNQREIFINTYAFFGESSGSGNFTFVLEGITGNDASMHSVTIDAAQLQIEGYAGYSLDEMLNPSLTLWSMLSPSRVWNEAATSPEVIAAAEALFADGLSQDDRALLESFKIINLEEYLFLLDPDIPLADRLDALDQLAELFEQNGYADAARRIDRVNFAFEALSTVYNFRAANLNAVEDALFNSATYLQAIGNRTAEEELLLRALVGSPGYPEEGLLTTLHRESQTVLINASQEGGNLVEGRRALQNIQQNLLPQALAFMAYEASLEGERSLLQQIYGPNNNARTDEFHNVMTQLEETIPTHLQPSHAPGEYLTVLEQQFSQVPQIH